MIKIDLLDEGGFQMDSRLQTKYIALFPHNRELFLPVLCTQLLDNAVVRDGLSDHYAEVSGRDILLCLQGNRLQSVSDFSGSTH